MKRLFILLFSLLCINSGHTQIAQWVIPYQYDNMILTNNGETIVADSLDYKIIWDTNGNRLGYTTYHLNSYNEGKAVATQDNRIMGFYNRNGAFIEIRESNAHTTTENPTFSNGYLLVQKNSHYYGYADTLGNINSADLIYAAYPYANGYATCEAYRNLKKKSTYCLLLNDKGEKTSFTYKGKIVDEEEIDYISSMTSQDTAIVILKGKLFFFDGKKLTPISSTPTETNDKHQAKLPKDLHDCITQLGDKSSILNAKCGKNEYVKIKFDSARIPVSISINGNERLFRHIQPTEYQPTTKLITTTNDSLYGLNYGNKEMLPAQFDSVVICFNNKAIVKKRDKYGMISINRHQTFQISVNKGDDIGFRHKKYSTTLRIDMPTSISSEAVYIDSVVASQKCTIDKTSRIRRDTKDGNFVEYNCDLFIPDSIPDTITEFTYSTRVQYNELTSPYIQYDIRAWHFKNYTINEEKDNRVIKDTILSYTFKIEQSVSDVNFLYPIFVEIFADSQKIDLTKHSEYKYTASIPLQEGYNNIVIEITEDGCPTISYPVGMTYNKPVAETDQSPAKEGSIDITYSQPVSKSNLKKNKKTKKDKKTIKTDQKTDQKTGIHIEI